MANWVEIRKEYMKRTVNGENVVLSELARKHNVKPGTLRSRKNREEWDEVLNKLKEEEKKNLSKSVATDSDATSKSVATDNKDSLEEESNKPVEASNKANTKTVKGNVSRRISMLGNKNSVGNKGGDGAKKGNRYAEKHGFYSKILPEETIELFEELEEVNYIDMLWHNIKIQYAAILRSQQIMYVEDQDDTRQFLTKDEVINNEFTRTIKREYEIHTAWDIQEKYLQAQSRAFSELRSQIKQYNELIETGLATKEQKLRIKKLEIEIDSLEEDKTSDNTNKWADAVKSIAAKHREEKGIEEPEEAKD